MTKSLRLSLAATLALAAAAGSAQTTGTIIGVVTDASTGKPVEGAVVVATSPSLQGEQTAVTDGNGNYRLTLLPPGEYRLSVQLEGFRPSDRSDIRLSLDKTLRANLAVVPEAVRMDEVVIRTGAAPVVNVGSAESGSVISSEFVGAVPVGRTFDQVAQVAPTAQADLYGTGFAGAQSPENSYVLDGLNVADPTYGTNNGAILSNFVQEIDVKTGNFSAEYGRATGGVMNVVTKSGSNEFHGSVFGNFTPSFLVSPDGPVAGNEAEAIAARSKAKEGDYDLDVGFEVGGPIVKDRLWFFAGFAPIVTERNTERFLRRNVLDGAGNVQWNDDGALSERIPGTETVTRTGATTYQFAGKLSYLLDENNQLTAATYGTPSHFTAFATPNAEIPVRTVDRDVGSLNVLGRYSGKFVEKRLILEALAGYHRSHRGDNPDEFQRNTPITQWRRPTGITSFASPGPDGTTYEPMSAEAIAACTGDPDLCPVTNYLTGGYGFGSDYVSDRLQAKVSASYLLEAAGSHNIKAGIDLERNSFDIKKYYSGGRFYRADSSAGEVYNIRGYGRVLDAAGNPALAGDTVEWIPVESSQSVNDSFAYFVQDAWTLPATGVTLGLGMRLETQSMEATNLGGIKGIDIRDMWSPRVQAVWDFTGTGRGKMAGSWGRFYYAIPLDMGDRAFGNEEQASGGWDCGEVTPSNVPRDANGNCALIAGWWDGTSAYGNVGAITPVQPDLKGIYVDQFGGQIEYELLSDLSIGFDYQGRRQGSMVEDMSDDDGNTYFIANPGQGGPFQATYLPGTANEFTVEKNPKQVQAFDGFRRVPVTVDMPAPTRSYDGYTVKVTKAFSRRWLAQASYTYSALRGNVAGVFDPVTGQLDPGINAEYDLATLMANKTGPLPGDRPHVVKLFGAYGFDLGTRTRLTASAAFNAASGTPVDATGRHPLYGNGYAYIVSRGGAGRTPFTTQLDLGGRLEYTIRAPYAVRFSLDAFNVLNTQEVLAMDTNYTFDTVQPIPNLKCDSTAAGSSNPIGTLGSDCPDVAYLKTTSGSPVTPNPNFGRPFGVTPSYQAPLSLRVGVALTF